MILCSDFEQEMKTEFALLLLTSYFSFYQTFSACFAPLFFWLFPFLFPNMWAFLGSDDDNYDCKYFRDMTQLRIRKLSHVLSRFNAFDVFRWRSSNDDVNEVFVTDYVVVAGLWKIWSFWHDVLWWRRTRYRRFNRRLPLPPSWRMPDESWCWMVPMSRSSSSLNQPLLSPKTEWLSFPQTWVSS